MIIALVIGGLTIRRFNIPYLYYLGSILVIALFLTDPTLVGNTFVKLLYPWFVPVFFMVGPGLYGSFCTIEERRNRWHIIHYLPVLIGYSILLIHLAFFNDHFYATVSLAHQLDLSTTEVFWPFSDRWILLAYPFHLLLYILWSIYKLTDSNAKKLLYVLPIVHGLYLIPIFDIIHNFLTGNVLIFPNAQSVSYLMVGLVLIIFWDVVNIRPTVQKQNEAEALAYAEKKRIERELALVQESPKEVYPRAEKIPNPEMVLYLNGLLEGKEAFLFNTYSKKAEFIRHSPFNQIDWERFFSTTSTSFGFFKKYLRIHRAIRLMEEGCLEKQSIEQLAKTVGYSSRAPFYIAFEQITG
ncbi:MAG: hypothetical protein L7S65_02855, partial [Schleiferiaceae bacterium]|nr:hypothetical protein [Schleiferiaceae bacterium]